jgi:hypothetical protein
VYAFMASAAKITRRWKSEPAQRMRNILSDLQKSLPASGPVPDFSTRTELLDDLDALLLVDEMQDAEADRSMLSSVSSQWLAASKDLRLALRPALRSQRSTPAVLHNMIIYVLDKFHSLAAEVTTYKPGATVPKAVRDQISVAGSALRGVVRMECVQAHFKALSGTLEDKLRTSLATYVSDNGRPAQEQEQDKLDEDGDEEMEHVVLSSWDGSGKWAAMPRFLRFAAAHADAVNRLCRSSQTRSRANFSLANLQVQLLTLQAPVPDKMESVYDLAAKLLEIEPVEAQARFQGVVGDKKDKTEEDITRTATTFRGAIHCEAVLASLVHLASVDYQGSPSPNSTIAAFKDASPIFGISKICCPCCAELLRRLGHGKYSYRGKHTNFYACSLPEELPLDVLQNMVDFAETALRPRLEAFGKMSRADSEGNLSSSSEEIGGGRYPENREARLTLVQNALEQLKKHQQTAGLGSGSTTTIQAGRAESASVRQSSRIVCLTSSKLHPGDV